MAEDDDWQPIAFVVYDLAADTVTAKRLLPEGIEIDSVTISPLGNFFLVYFDTCYVEGQLGTDARPCGLMVYDRTLQNGRRVLRIIGHSDTAVDADGKEVLVYQDIDTDYLSMLDLASGLVTPLFPIDFSRSPTGMHFSGRADRLPGWVPGATYSGARPSATWMDDQVFAVELRAGGRVVRLAHTHSIVDEQQEHDYWAEPHASVSHDFTRISFTSNWGRSGTGEVETYLLACPVCHGLLEAKWLYSDPVETGRLICRPCDRFFEIKGGIPHFIRPEELAGLNRRFARMYDLFSWFYRSFSKIAFRYIGMDEGTGRREITDRLDPQGGNVLEVSICPGNNLPDLMGRPDVGEVFGLDISLGQLDRCRRYLQRNAWEVDLFLGNAEQLPFCDNSFSGVLHVGGINFFNDKQAAIEEMVRVAKPGARILIADETEKGARGYERFLPGFKRSFNGKRQNVTPPLNLVPGSMLELRLYEIWRGWFYCNEFRKP